jgi:cystathionine beta-lyase
MIKEGMENGLYNNDYIYLNIADMDFVCSDGIRAEMQKMVDFNIYGYTKSTHDYGHDFYDAILTWIKKTLDLDLKRENIFYGQGVLGASSTIGRAFLKPGDKVLINRPLYGPLSAIPSYTGNEVVNSQLVYHGNGDYTLNFEEIERITADPKVTMYLFCSPHNPVGRVWTKEELLKVYEICRKNNVLLVSDEVHSDFVWEPNKFVSLAQITDGKGLIVCSGFAKTFNLAGLKPAYTLVTDPELLPIVAKSNAWSWPEPFTIAAVKGACLNSDEWLKEVKAYIKGNQDAAIEFIKTNMPKVKWYQPQGTYTLWLDFSDYGYTDEELHERIYAKAKVFLEDGTEFDPEHGQGFQRICLPSPRSRILEALERIANELA